MNQSTTMECRPHATPHASLAALGCKLQQLDLFGPIRDQVQIPQKTVRYSPTDKLYAAWIALLAGAEGVVDLNRLVRADPALQRAFGQPACAEQSTVQDTLDAATATTVTQMEAALATIFRRHSAAYRHPYRERPLLLDIDLTPAPCGKQAEGASKGYFGPQRNHYGRQIGRVVASEYEELVCERVLAGNTQLNTSLPDLVLAAEAVLHLNRARRERTIIRIDAGAGSVEDLRWLLARGYQVLGKDYSSVRARHQAEQVAEWVADHKVAGREAGWVVSSSPDYGRPVVRVAVRCRKKNGQWSYGLLLTTLTPAQAQALSGPLPEHGPAGDAALWTYVYSYDGRGGGCETQNKADKQGLRLTARNKKRLAAQQLVVYLTQLAHNVFIWARAWLAPHAPGIARYGVKRLVREVLGSSGQVLYGEGGPIQAVILNAADRLAQRLVPAWQALLPPQQLIVCLGEI
jgi:hypothetical protein